MALNKVFIILALVASCTLAMPVHPVDQTTQSIDVESTSDTINIKVEDSTIGQESITTLATDEATTGKDETSVTESTAKNVADEELVDEDVAKRSIEKASSDADDLETAAGTNVLRPLFVYRQQVAYRQRIRNAYRRGNRRF